MRNIERKLLLMEFENYYNQYEGKINLLNNIIIFFNEQEKKETEHTNLLNDEHSKLLDYDNEFCNEEDKTETIYEESNYDTDKKEDLLPIEIKTIYRKIMMITHPDKIKDKTREIEYKKKL